MSTADDVVERVRHRVTPARPGALTATDDAYRAWFGDGGFSLALSRRRRRRPTAS